MALSYSKFDICLQSNPPTSEVSVLTADQVWESWWLLTNGQQFTVQNHDHLYVLVSSTHKTIRRDMTYTVQTAT